MRRVVSYSIAVLFLATAIGVLVPLFGFGLPFGASATVEPGGSVQSVNRTHKGNRLSVPVSAEQRQQTPTPTRTPGTIMVGCDPAFSPLAASAQANFSSRCVV